MKPRVKIVWVIEWSRWAFKVWYGPHGDCKQVFRTSQAVREFLTGI